MKTQQVLGLCALALAFIFPSSAQAQTRAGSKCTIYWSCSAVADVYLNGAPLKPYSPDYMKREGGEWNRILSVETNVARGDKITVGARRGNTWGFTLVILDETKKPIFVSNSKDWKPYAPKDEAKWFQPATAIKSMDGVSVQRDPSAAQKQIVSKYASYAHSIWDNQKNTVFLIGTVD